MGRDWVDFLPQSTVENLHRIHLGDGALTLGTTSCTLSVNVLCLAMGHSLIQNHIILQKGQN